MEIKLSKNDKDIYLMELSGSLDLFSSNQLKDLIMQMVGKKVEHFIINLKNVDKINSSGIGALVYVSSTMKKISCPLIIIAPKGPVLHALEVTRLKGYFTIVSNLNEAISQVGSEL